MLHKQGKSANKSFILRFWQEEADVGKSNANSWRASLESIHDQDKSRYVSDASGLLELLESAGVENVSLSEESKES